MLAAATRPALPAQQDQSNSSQPDPPEKQAQSVARAKSVSDELRLAEKYEFGKGVPKDLAQSLYWYRKAADHGDPGAQIQLGYFYFKGIGVERDPAESARWFARAVGTGSPTAKLNLAVLYLRGVGVPRDPELALNFLDELARKGDTRAEAYLGIMYQNGFGVAQDQATAERWFLKAAKGNGPEGQFGMGVLFSVSPQHEHDYRKAIDFLRRSAHAGYIPAMHALGVLLIDHPEVAQNQPNEALTMLRRAAEAGSWRASASLGLLFRDGRAVPRDAAESLRWLTIAVRQGGADAETSLRWDLDRSRELLTSSDQQRMVQSAQSWLADHPAPSSLFARAGSGPQFP
ncbi:MAG TPA: tetratricopeptide repeat protein [Terracidiphilus sp.]|nr:tetratricopeptide repeat protein [Terracidiphilus sp.]